MAHVCSHKHVWTFDNFLRPLVHSPEKIFGPYVKPGMRVLDVGCGAGFAALGLARLVGEEGKVVAVDVQPEMLAKVDRRAVRAGLSGRIETLCSPAENLQVDGSFDFVNAFYMVHELPEKAPFFQGIHDRLLPLGQLLIVEPKFHVTAINFQKMLQVAEINGLTVSAHPRVLASRAVVLTRWKVEG